MSARATATTDATSADAGTRQARNTHAEITQRTNASQVGQRAHADGHQPVGQTIDPVNPVGRDDAEQCLVPTHGQQSQQTDAVPD